MESYHILRIDASEITEQKSIWLEIIETNSVFKHIVDILRLKRNILFSFILTKQDSKLTKIIRI